jgi:uncharacterized protein YjiS (DUF1127 family)
MALTVSPPISHTGIASVLDRAAAWTRAWYRAQIEARERAAAQRIGAYLRNLDDQRLKDLGIERAEIDRRFGSSRNGAD